jgi:hypothetical protein
MREHAGRVQAQGNRLQQSRKWEQDSPLTSKEGHRMLDDLYALLNETEREEREVAFAKAHTWIDAVELVGGIQGFYGRSFGHPPGNSVRVDIEVSRGLAFVRG